MTRRRFGAAGLSGLALAAMAGPAGAAEILPSPQGETVLTVTGGIGVGNARDPAGRPEARFDRAMLLHQGVTEFVTRTPWHQGAVRFEGVLLRRVLDAVQAAGGRLRLVALNDYVAEMPADDARRFDVLLALRANGHDLGLRDKGPVFVVYPYDTDAELRTDVIYSRSVWQLRRIEVR